MMTSETQRIASLVATRREDYDALWANVAANKIREQAANRETAILDRLDAELTYLAPGDAVGKVEAIRAAAADLVQAGVR